MEAPKTQRQIAAEKKKKEQQKEYVDILNNSRMMIGIQLKSPEGIDFLLGEQTVRLMSGKRFTFDKSRLYWDSQIRNLQKRGVIKVFSK